LDLRKGFHEPVEKPKRFYKAVTVTEVEGGWQVLLDGRNLRTPKAERMILPTRAVAEQVAEEWAGQGEILEMATMHATRLANTAIETIGGLRDGVAAGVVEAVHRVGIAAERLGRRHVLDAVPLPQAARVAERGHAALGGYPGTGEHDKSHASIEPCACWTVRVRRRAYVR